MKKYSAPKQAHTFVDSCLFLLFVTGKITIVKYLNIHYNYFLLEKSSIEKVESEHAHLIWL
jgi:hypothetical protein